MNVIRTNKPNFFGNAGEPLQSGYIYIGQPNQDPIEFDKTVTFEDSQGNQSTAAQPLRTDAQGQITYNGKAMISLVDGNYSMLILDSTQTQMPDGYTPLVEPSESSGGTSDLTAYRENSLLLADVKKLVKAPGQTVRSIGATSTTDREGVDWLVVSATGSPADDVDLIDFDNGLQGQRIVNNLSVLKNLEEIADAGGAAQTAAIGNINGIEDTDDTVTSINLAETTDERDWVLARNSEAALDAVGTYAFLGTETSAVPTTFTHGSVYAIISSFLEYAGIEVDGSSVPVIHLSGTPTGNWMCMGYVSIGANDFGATLFLKVS